MTSPTCQETESTNPVQQVFPKGPRLIPGRTADSDGARIAKSWSRSIPDPFAKDYGAESGLLKPLVAPATLSALAQKNPTLKACIAAMAANVVGRGLEFRYIGPREDEEEDHVQEQLERLEGLLAGDGTTSLKQALHQFWVDFETFGYAYLEVVRSSSGRPALICHVPSQHTRMSSAGELVEVDVPAINKKGKRVLRQQKRRFRRFLQEVTAGLGKESRKAWFKEFGDPRSLSVQSGKYGRTVTEIQASELLCLRNYDPATTYGLPRWHSQIPNIEGAHEATMWNLETLVNNGVPFALLMVSGGSVNPTTMEVLEQAVSGVRGRASVGRIVVVEGIGDTRSAGDHGGVEPPKMELKMLASERQLEGMFADYKKDVSFGIMLSFGLAPIILGMSQDHTQATAAGAIFVAESMTFAPARARLEDMLNSRVLPEMDITHYEIRFKGAEITDSEEQLRVIEVADKIGAMTPNMAIPVINRLLGTDRELISEDWGDVPFATTIAAKAAAEAANEDAPEDTGQMAA